MFVSLLRFYRCWRKTVLSSCFCIRKPAIKKSLLLPRQRIWSSSFVSFAQFSPTCGRMPLPALSLWPGRQPYRPRLLGGRRGDEPSSESGRLPEMTEKVADGIGRVPPPPNKNPGYAVGSPQSQSTEWASS